jgi:hypothetical protein
VQGVEAITQRGVGVGIQVAVVVEGEADRGVAGPGGDLLEAGAGGDAQRVLELPGGVLVARIICTAYAGDQPVEVMDTISNGEAVSYRFEIQV